MVMEIFFFLFNMIIRSFQIGVIFKRYMVLANFMSTFFHPLHWFLCPVKQKLIFFLWKSLPCLFPSLLTMFYSLLGMTMSPIFICPQGQT